MRIVFTEAARSFAKAFIWTFVVLIAGILAAPNLHEQRALAAAAGLAAVAAGIKSVQVYVPALTVAAYIAGLPGLMIDSFLRAAVASLCVTLPGALTAPDLNTMRSLAVAAIVGAGTAGVTALEGFLTKGMTPKLGSGLPTPPRQPGPTPPPRP